MQERLQKQHNQNCTAYIITYAFVGILGGLIYDILVTYLSTVSPSTAKSMAAYMGIATFAAAATAVLASRIGYKRLMMFAAAVSAASLLLIANSQSQWLVGIGLLSLMTGTTLFDVMLAPFIAAHTTEMNRTSVFAKTSFTGILGLTLGTSVGGPIIVWIFSRKLDVAYSKAKLLTANIDSLSIEQYSSYIGSYRIVLMAFAVISVLMLIPAFFIREAAEDYRGKTKTKSSQRSGFSELINKYVLLFLFYTVLSKFAGALIVPQVSIYLTKIGMNRAAVSMLATLQYLAILGFMLFSTRIVRKVGQVYAIAVLSLASIPFMIILANGYHYGNRAPLIIGFALFFRTGLSNAAAPAVNSLTMELVSDTCRPLYASLIFVMQSLAQIAAGLFANFYLFSRDSGYANAYYYAAVLSIIAHGMLLMFFRKRHNPSPTVYCEKIMENSHAEG